MAVEKNESLTERKGLGSGNEEDECVPDDDAVSEPSEES